MTTALVRGIIAVNVLFLNPASVMNTSGVSSERNASSSCVFQLKHDNGPRFEKKGTDLFSRLKEMSAQPPSTRFDVHLPFFARATLIWMSSFGTLLEHHCYQTQVNGDRLLRQGV